MNRSKLEERLKELGAPIPRGTLQRWAGEGIVPSPVTYYKKRTKVGRPTEGKQGKAGRFKYWLARTVEEAAAVWAIRNLSLIAAPGTLAPLNAKKGKKQVHTDVVRCVQRRGRFVEMLLATDCKKAASLFRSCLWPKSSPSAQDLENYLAQTRLTERKIHPLVPTWLLSLEKARNEIKLSKQACLLYKWVIEENGKSSYKGKFVRELASKGIELEVTHLNPAKNGYSKEYGYPDLGLFDRGFRDVFTLTEHGELFENFRILGTGNGLKDFHETIDPNGVGANWADDIYSDFY
jgi:hypothetical protein